MKDNEINYNNRDGKNKEEISLREFVYRFVAPNTLVRVWYQNADSTYTLLPAYENPTKKYITMEHGIEYGNSYEKYLNKRFVKVTDIRCDEYPEAVNIVIDLNTDIL